MMDMDRSAYTELSLRELRVLDALLRERSITFAGAIADDSTSSAVRCAACPVSEAVTRMWRSARKLARDSGFEARGWRLRSTLE